MKIKISIIALASLAFLTGCGGSPALSSHITAPAAPPESTSSISMPGMDMSSSNSHAHTMDYVPTPGQGGQPLDFTLDHGVKVFHLEAKEVQWEPTPGHKVTAWTYNGTVPGPMIRVTEGDHVRIEVKNSLPEPVTLHSHGMEVPAGQDGMPGLNGEEPIAPGQTHVYEYVAKPAGTHWYHSHFDSANEVTKGMYGPLIVDPKTPEPVHYDRDYTYMIGDSGDLGFVLNGKGFPSTQPIDVKEGDRVRLRFIGTGVMAHPMHLHGHTLTVIARDGYPLPQPYQVDTFTVSPGESWDVTFVADNPGTWVFHCHILPHAETKDGMMGLTTVVRYQK